MDKPKAVAAAARKLARLISTMPAKGDEFTSLACSLYRIAIPKKTNQVLTAGEVLVDGLGRWD